MQEAYDLIQLGDKSKLTVYYHADKKGNVRDENGKLLGNAFKSQILPKLDTSSFLNEYGFIDINKIQTDTIKRQIVNEIKNSVKEKVQKTFDSLFDNNIIEKINENNYNTRQLDSVIFNSYKGDNKNANKSIIYNIRAGERLRTFSCPIFTKRNFKSAPKLQTPSQCRPHTPREQCGRSAASGLQSHWPYRR